MTTMERRNSMKKYRKKPVTIEAMQFTKDQLPDIGHEIAKLCGGRLNIDTKPSDPTDVRYTISIPTLEGVMTASLGDYVIRGVQGEFYPCKPDIFEATYEPVEVNNHQSRGRSGLRRSLKRLRDQT